MIKTVTLEQAKKIDKLGIKIDTYFVWDNPYLSKKEDGWGIVERWMIEENSEVMISAPTVVEMLDRMPDSIKIDGYAHDLTVTKDGNTYSIGYPPYEWEYAAEEWPQFENESLSVAVGDMFIWCAENGHLIVNKSDQ